MKYGFSIWYGSKSILSEIERAGRLGFDYVELSLDFVWPEGLEKQKKMIKNSLKENGLEMSFIAPHTDVRLANPRREIREGGQKLLKKVLKFATYFNPPFLIFYIRGGSEPLNFAGYLPKYKFSIIEDAINKAALESFDILTKKAKKYNIKLALENSGRGLFSKMKDFRLLITDDRFHLCCDIGHILRSSSLLNDKNNYTITNIKKWYDFFGRKIIASHIHDAKIEGGKVRDHLNLGEGNLDMKKVASLLSKTKCNYIKLETFSAYNSDYLMKENLKNAKNVFG